MSRILAPLAPLKTATPLQLDQRLLDDLAKVTALAGIHHDFAGGWH